MFGFESPAAGSRATPRGSGTQRCMDRWTVDGQGSAVRDRVRDGRCVGAGRGQGRGVHHQRRGIQRCELAAILCYII
jgi:hypothetical protein